MAFPPKSEMIKDLRPFKAHELVLGGTFYWKLPNGEFDRQSISVETVKDPNSARTIELRQWVKEQCAAGNLFTRIQEPFCNFSGFNDNCIKWLKKG